MVMAATDQNIDFVAHLNRNKKWVQTYKQVARARRRGNFKGKSMSAMQAACSQEFGPDGYNQAGFNIDGFNIDGLNFCGFNRWELDPDGYDSHGAASDRSREKLAEMMEQAKL
jgi:hypothetical protein